MAIRTPGFPIGNANNIAEDLRRLMAVLGNAYDDEGVVLSTDLAVSEKSGTPDMSVDVAAGRAFIKGTEDSFQGTYFVENESTTNLAIAAADPTNDRIDLVVAKVEDSDYSGSTDAWSLAVVTGTPAASPSAPSAPSNSITLAQVSVGAAVSSITNSDITDTRGLWGVVPAAHVRASGGQTVGATTATAQLDTIVFETVDGMVNTGTYRITIPKDGIYQIDFGCTVDPSTTSGTRTLRMKLNGTDNRRAQQEVGTGGNRFFLHRSFALDLSEDDYLTLEYESDATGTNTFGTNVFSEATWLSVHYVGPPVLNT